MMTVLNYQQARHLVTRSGIGAEYERIKTFEGQTLVQAVSLLLNKKNTTVLPPPEFSTFETLRKLRKRGDRKAIRKLKKQEGTVLKHWAIQHLLYSDNPLHEHMIWFWHNHFTSSLRKVKQADWIFKQHVSIRQHATGNFSTLLKTMTFDPAMLIYLDGRNNKKDQPNENFARELLELFTLGEGHYSEQDVKQAARAFTGWTVNRRKNKVMLQTIQHDNGYKQFMGNQGNLSADDILNILLENPRTAEFICEKMWYEFISIETPDSLQIKHWADAFRRSGYDISVLLKHVFSSNAFWQQKYQGNLIKSPLDLVIGSLRTFEMEQEELPLRIIDQQLKRMGQDLFIPPNVKGWPEGLAWIDDVSLPIRQQFLNRLARGQVGSRKNQMSGMMHNTILNNHGKNLPEMNNLQLEQWLLAIPAVNRVSADNSQDLLKGLLLDPVYQLK